MISQKSDTIDTVEVYHLPDSVRVAQYLESINSFVQPSKIVQELNINRHTVYTNLQRLKRKGRVQHRRYSGWKWISSSVSESEKSDTVLGWGGPEVYQSQHAARKLATQLFDYKMFHGLEVHLELIHTDTKFDTLYNTSTITLENRKLRVRSSHDPIPFSEADKLCGFIQRILEAELGYSGPAWLVHIELNHDVPGFKIDGAQRIEFSTFMGNIHRMYNKRIGRDKFLRIESVIHQKSGLVPLTSGLALVGVARDFDNMLYMGDRMNKRLRGVMGHVTHWEHQAIAFNQKIDGAVDFFQAQTMDLQTAMDTGMESLQIQVQKLSQETERSNQYQDEMLEHTKMQTALAKQQLMETGISNDRLEEIREFIRELSQNRIDWKLIKKELKEEILVILRKLEKPWSEIARILGYSSKSGPYNFVNRNFPDILKSDTPIDTVVNPINFDLEVQDPEIDKNVNELYTESDTPVNPIRNDLMIGEKIIEVINGSPGINVRKILESINHNRGDVLEKLHQLRDSNKIDKIKFKNHHRYYVKGEK